MPAKAGGISTNDAWPNLRLSETDSSQRLESSVGTKNILNAGGFFCGHNIVEMRKASSLFRQNHLDCKTISATLGAFPIIGSSP